MRAGAFGSLRPGDASRVFAGPTFDAMETDGSGGGKRVLTAGLLGEAVVIVAWRRKGPGRQVLAMRAADPRESALYRARLGAA